MHMATQRGYTPQQLRELDYIIEHESGWNPSAVNSSSGAWGIPQIMPLTGRPQQGTLTPRQQIQWALNYLDSHAYEGYGTGIDAAYQHKLATGWY